MLTTVDAVAVTIVYRMVVGLLTYDCGNMQLSLSGKVWSDKDNKKQISTPRYNRLNNWSDGNPTLPVCSILLMISNILR